MPVLLCKVYVRVVECGRSLTTWSYCTFLAASPATQHLFLQQLPCLQAEAVATQGLLQLCPTAPATQTQLPAVSHWASEGTWVLNSHQH